MKRYALIVYKAKHAWDNRTDSIYASGEYDNKEHTVVHKETNSFQTLMKLWGENLKHYEGYTYCIRDRGPLALNQVPAENLLFAGAYSPDDEEVIRSNFHNREFFSVLMEA